MSDEVRGAQPQAAKIGSIGEQPEEPEWVYFYYITKAKSASGADAGNGPEARHPGWSIRAYLQRKETGSFNQEAIERLIKKADDNVIEPVGFSVTDLRLRYRGYMLFVWRETGRTLLDVDFIYAPDQSKKNHSFDKMKQREISPGLSYVYRDNIRLNKDLRPLGECGLELEPFKVEFRTDPALPVTEDHIGGDPELARRMVIHNEVPTNVGP